MREDIKKRIEAVRRGEVPEGYRRTRAGLMPLDWIDDYSAKDIFRNCTNKNHNGEFEVLSATQERGVIPRSDIDIDIKYAEENVGAYKKVDIGDFIISLRSFQGGIEYSKYEGVVSPAYTVLKAIKPISDGFYQSYFKSPDFITRLSGAVYGIRDGKQIGFSDFGELTLHYPPIEEQKKIAEILSICDRVIELKKKLVEELQQLKKTCLAKMFPRNGADVPELRFPGFTDPWEQHKLGDIASSFEYGLNAAAKEYDGVNKYLRITDIDDSSHAFRDDDLTSPDIDLSSAENYRLQEGEILFARTGASVGKTYIYKEFDGLVYFAGFLIRAKIKPEYDAEFVFQNTLCTAYEKYIQITSQRSGQPGVNAQEYAEYSFSLPCYTEQKKIGNLLRQIDDLITLHQRELDAEQKKKKALMQLLLTGLARVIV